MLKLASSHPTAVSWSKVITDHGMLLAKSINNIGMDQGDDKMLYLIDQQEGGMRSKHQKKAKTHDWTKKQRSQSQ
jgi:hypothetical protein